MGLVKIVTTAAFIAGLPAAASAAEYKLSTNLPLTGSWANYGLGMNNSFRLAVEQGNASGILGGDKIVVVDGDDAGSASQSSTRFALFGKTRPSTTAPPARERCVIG